MMNNYLFVYHGGKEPESEEEFQSTIKAWQQWYEGMGNAVVDGGNPVGPNITVHAGGKVTNDGGSNPVTGYGVFKASDAEASAELASKCPILDAGGSVEVAQVFDMSQA
ncbi:hypothetical protein QWZ13_01060 [Reinekea marina]|uniref:YCII-related domain-containing protein n=1 Tax=Reinekea marina TaxID=1310421 RepID=A0ABV7WUR2_9GAMM|nr:hypothetical protein [Reinekea marina]MDN3647491.1 hypothetical protein [Reinekea marina]